MVGSGGTHAEVSAEVVRGVMEQVMPLSGLEHIVAGAVVAAKLRKFIAVARGKG